MTEEKKQPEASKAGKPQRNKPVMVWFSEPVKTAITDLAVKNDRPIIREIERAVKAWLAQHGCLPEGE